jgi:hypothetical protein
MLERPNDSATPEETSRNKTGRRGMTLEDTKDLELMKIQGVPVIYRLPRLDEWRPTFPRRLEETEWCCKEGIFSTASD